MTGYTVHTGSNDKFREGWDNIFQSKKSKTAQKKKPAASASGKASKDAGGKQITKKR